MVSSELFHVANSYVINYAVGFRQIDDENDDDDWFNSVSKSNGWVNGKNIANLIIELSDFLTARKDHIS